MQRGVILRAVALAALGAVAAAAASSIAAHRSIDAIAVPPASGAVALQAPHTTCTAGPRIDAQLTNLVAPVVITRLAHPLRAEPTLGRARRVFPLPGPYPAFADTFGAARAGVSWHHGDDLFAARGTPVLAVANGVVFSVGWQRLGGRRLWLIDRDGDEYYYAHLERYAPTTRNGEDVSAGQVLGYVGTTGDAEGTPPHLHFEVHPAALLHLGYDGAVDPTHYLRGWAQVAAGSDEPLVAARCLSSARSG